MKTPLLLLVCCLLAPAGGLFAQLTPQIASPEPVFDFGTAREGEMVTHRFILMNRGKGLLRLQRLHSTCGCTVSRPDSMEIPGGEAVSVEVRLDLTGRTGPQEQRVQVFSNDPRTPVLDLMLIGTSLPEVEVEPRVVNFQRIDPEAPPTATISVRSTTDRPLHITGLRTQRDLLELTQEVLEENREYRIALTPKAGAASGHFSDSLEILTDHPASGSIRVVVLWQVTPPMSVSPATLHLVAGRNREALTRYLLVRPGVELEEPLRVENVEWPGRDIGIEINDAGNFGIRIQLSNIVALPEMNGEEILVHTNVPGFEQLKVPVRVQR